jgi:hypothetical protein
MKKLFFATAVVCLFALAAFAQKAPNFGGTWTLDVSKSKLGDRNNIESQTLTVTQTDKDVKIETATKRTPPPANAGGGGGMGGGRMGGGGDMPMTYTLDGKEMKMDMAGPGGNTIPVSMTGKVDGGKLYLTRSSTFNGPNGAMTSTTKETWELSGDGKTLTISTERTSPRGTDTTTKVFTKS